MKTLLILRHAKSSWKDEKLTDRDRPLSKRGKRQAPEMGEMLRSLAIIPDVLLSSPARRARDTAVLVAEKCGYAGEVEFVNDFYPGGRQEYLQVLNNLPDDVECVLVVGHNPGLEDLLAMLLRRAEVLSTAALAQVSLPVEHWWQVNEDTRGTLVRIWRPAEEEG